MKADTGLMPTCRPYAMLNRVPLEWCEIIEEFPFIAVLFCVFFPVPRRSFQHTPCQHSAKARHLLKKHELTMEADS